MKSPRSRKLRESGACPSTILRMVPLPLQGRNGLYPPRFIL